MLVQLRTLLMRVGRFMSMVVQQVSSFPEIPEYSKPNFYGFFWWYEGS